MQAAIQLGGMAAVFVISIAFALLLEWLSLWGLMKLMPGPKPAAEAASIRIVPVRRRRIELSAAGR